MRPLKGERDMMKKIMGLLGLERQADGSSGEAGKEVEYRYIYMLQDGSVVVSAVCAG